jgi:hypothetical protein
MSFFVAGGSIIVAMRVSANVWVAKIFVLEEFNIIYTDNKVG